MPNKTDLTLPEDCTIDVHDLAAIILDCHWRTEPMFRHARLVEIVRDDIPLQTFPPHILPPEWHALGQSIYPSRRVAYLLRQPQPEQDNPSDAAIGVVDFPHPDGVKLPRGTPPLKRRDLENAYWRCKDYDNGYHLSYVAQRTFDSLPKSTVLRARTSKGYSITFSPHQVAVFEFKLLPHEPCLIIDYSFRPDISPTAISQRPHLSGFPDFPIPWVCLTLGPGTNTNVEDDTRVILDLATPQMGGRGSGGELFALERGAEYFNNLIPRYALQSTDLVMSEKLRPSDPTWLARGEELLGIVLTRLKPVMEGNNEFCRYCGKDGVETQCSKCQVARFCRECQALGWKYHKVWC